MKWSFWFMVACACWVAFLAGFGASGAFCNDKRIDRLEVLSGQNCARIDTLEAFYAE